VYFQTVSDVALHRHVWKQRVALEDRVHITTVGRPIGYIATADLHTSLVWPHETADDPERGGLAASARTEDGQEFGRANL
jgi:hypothetical protein